MDRVGSGLTNLHYLEGVLFVEWTTFRSPQPVETALGEDEAPAKLDQAVCDLWYRGQLAFHDRELASLWFFVLSGPSVSRDAQVQSKANIVSDVTTKHDLFKVSAGSLRASEIPDFFYDDHKDPAESRWSNSMTEKQAPSENATEVIARPSSPSHASAQDNIRIYTALQQAIASSIIHRLLRTGRWLRLGPKTLIAREQLTEREESLDAWPGEARISLNVQLKTVWLPNGTILVLVHARKQLNPLSMVPAATQTILAPLGLKAQVVRDDSKAFKIFSGEDRATRDWESYIDQWMRSRGAELTQRNAWVRVKIKDSKSSEANDEGFHLLWPLELCFTRSERPKGPSRSGRGDPLLDSERWLAENEKRKPLLEMQRNERKQSSIPKPYTSHDDAMLAVLKRGEGALEAQAVMGIYPTPPDGARAQHAPMLEECAQRSRPEDELGARILSEQSDELSAPKASYDNLDEELFGQMDAGTYQDNGITEDDFSFFDEPDQTPRELPDATVVAGEDTEMTSPLEDTMNIGLRFDTNGKDNESLDFTMKDAPIPQADHESVPTLQLPQSAETSMELVTSQLRLESSSIMPPVDKYGAQGKFASLTPAFPTTIRPSRSPERGQIIPRLRDGESRIESKSSPESTASEDDDSSPDPLPPKRTTNGKSTKPTDPVIQANEQPMYDSMASEDPEKLLNRLERNMADELTPRTKLLGFPPTPKFSEHYDSFIRLGQIIADQVVRYKNFSTKTGCLEGTQEVLSSASDVVRSVFPTSIQCGLEHCVKLANPANQNIASKNVRLNAKALGYRHGSESGSELVYKLPAPQFRAKRGTKLLDVSLQALRFWEEVGLSPNGGPKNITAFLLCPDLEWIRRGAASFLEAVGSTYMSLRLGLYVSGHSSVKGHRNGVVPLPASKDDALEKFGRSLQSLASQDSTLVIYMVNWTGELPELKHHCHLFLRIFDAYATSLRLSTAPSDVVLKVVPGAMIASSAYVALPTVPELIRIAKDIYDNCPTQTVSVSPYSSLSLVQLTPEVPDSVDFRLQIENPAVVLQEKSVAHVAYCWDEGSSWLTAALTDTLGCHSWSASFYTGVTPDALATFRAIAKEVLDVAREALEEAHGCPRIIITRDEPIHPSEAEVWTSLARAQKLSLAVVHIDPNPPLMLVSSNPTVTVDPITVIAPTTDLASPDLNAPKLAEEADPSARLVDPAEEISAVVSACTIDVENDSIALRPHEGSGYLVKPGGILMGMSVLATEYYNLDIRALLKLNHALTCLSKARGSLELPWHVAIARQAQSGLKTAGI